MPERNVVSWTSHGCARGGDPLMAVNLFNLMVSEGRVAPNSISVACAISACAKLKDIDNGERIFSYAVDSGIVISSSLLNTLVHLHMKCGSVEIAERIFCDCGDRSVVLWNTMLSNYSRGGMARKVIKLFDDMLIAGARHDKVTILAVASALAEHGGAVVALRFHGYVTETAWMLGMMRSIRLSTCT
ncbi:Pentatricopeptide repeat-containing protein [Platanthera guangdongensis]|uniref:Pentatricopeptide repeat-containing protein n=1 Tax=Platanthera guangdongensis TaxID=2320717 RepID=A0ABR2MGE4_9ASPA